MRTILAASYDEDTKYKVLDDLRITHTEKVMGSRAPFDNPARKAR